MNTASNTLALVGNSPLTSPYVLTVFAALEEKGLRYSFSQIHLDRGEQHQAGFVAQSISNRVPLFRHNDFSLSESSAICEYLEDVFSPPQYARLYPKDAREKARVRMVQALLRSDFLPIREERSTSTFLSLEPVSALSEAAQDAVAHLLRIATQIIAHKEFVAPEFSIADVDLAMMLQRLVANGDRVPEVLRAYTRRIWQRPSMQAWLALARYKKIEGN